VFRESSWFNLSFEDNFASMQSLKHNRRLSDNLTRLGLLVSVYLLIDRIIVIEIFSVFGSSTVIWFRALNTENNILNQLGTF